MIISSFIHVAANGINAFFSMVYVHHISLSVHLSVDIQVVSCAGYYVRRSVEDLASSLSTKKLSEVSYLTECSTEQFIIHLCGTKMCKPISGLRLMTLIFLLRKLSGCGLLS